MVMRCTCNADKRVRFSPAAVYRVPGPVAGRLSPKQQTEVRFFRYSYIPVLWCRSRFDSGHRKVDCSSTAEPQIVDLMMRVRLPPFQTDYFHTHCLMIFGCGFPNVNQNFDPAIEEFRQIFLSRLTVLTVEESPLFKVTEEGE